MGGAHPTFLRAANLELEITDTAKHQIATEGNDPVYGARPLKRVIQQRIQNPLASEILKGKHPEGSVVKIGFEGGNFTFESLKPATAEA